MPSIDIRQLPIDKVVLFSSRAEIKRTATVQLDAGLNEVAVQHIAHTLIDSMFRVQGTGNAIILDVVHDEKPALTEHAESQKVAEIRARLVQAKKELTESNNEVASREELLEAVKKAFNEGVTSHLKKNPEGDNDVPASLGTVDLLLDSYFAKLTTLKKDLDQAREANKKHVEQVDVIQRELNDVVSGNIRENSRIKTATISLEAAEATEVTFEFTYQVWSAGWSASYDVRVDEAADKNSLRLVYYGTIEQNTGEEWNDVPITLSTASPELGGTVPELGTLEASIYEPPRPEEQQNFYHRGNMAPQMMRTMAYDSAPAGRAMKKTMGHRVVEDVKKTALSIEFNIDKKQTIPTGTSGKKLTIGDVQLEPSLVHETVPSQRTVAFLTASATNTSQYSLASGPASIFFNNAFIAKTEVKDVSPGERFTVSLGVDTAVKVTYKPAKKYTEQVGVITKASTQANEQLIEIKNTHNDRPILIKVHEQVPRSTDEKIKITLVNPATVAKVENAVPTEGAVINSANNLEWTVKIEPSDSKNLSIKWSIEHPKENKIEYTTKY